MVISNYINQSLLLEVVDCIINVSLSANSQVKNSIAINDCLNI